MTPTIICHNCGQSNPADSMFCAKCATSLKHGHLQRARLSKTFIPPQEDVPLPSRRLSSSPHSSPQWLWWVGMMVVAGGLLIWLLHG